MSSSVTINPKTGIVTGIAPDAGIYVITVCVYERRNGILIATQRKDLQIKVGDCSVAAANLPPQTVNCFSFTSGFNNTGDQSLIHSYLWTFGEPGSASRDTSTLSNPTHSYGDTGTYTVTLITNRNELCSDTGTTIVKMYPGFVPGFRSTGICINKPTQFIDTTGTRYGFVNSWYWDFGVPSASTDTSHSQNPTFVYSAVGTYNAQLVVTSSKGCIDTVTAPNYSTRCK
jgi:PKD repeat protein